MIVKLIYNFLLLFLVLLLCTSSSHFFLLGFSFRLPDYQRTNYSPISGNETRIVPSINCGISFELNIELFTCLPSQCYCALTFGITLIIAKNLINKKSNAKKSGIEIVQCRKMHVNTQVTSTESFSRKSNTKRIVDGHETKRN